MCVNRSVIPVARFVGTVDPRQRRCGELALRRLAGQLQFKRPVVVVYIEFDVEVGIGRDVLGEGDFYARLYGIGFADRGRGVYVKNRNAGERRERLAGLAVYLDVDFHAGDVEVRPFDKQFDYLCFLGLHPKRKASVDKYLVEIGGRRARHIIDGNKTEAARQ